MIHSKCFNLYIFLLLYFAIFVTIFFVVVVATFEETGLCLKFFYGLGFADTVIFEEIIRLTQVSEFLKGIVKCM